MVRPQSDKENILKLIGDGCTISKACLIAEVPRQTVYNWRREDEEFEKRWLKAISKLIDTAEDTLKKANPDKWASKILQRHAREDWADEAPKEAVLTVNLLDQQEKEWQGDG